MVISPENLEKLTESVCRHFEIDRQELWGRTKRIKYCHARMLIWFFLRKHFGEPTFVEIAKATSGSKHTAPLYGYSRWPYRMRDNEVLRGIYVKVAEDMGVSLKPKKTFAQAVDEVIAAQNETPQDNASSAGEQPIA